MKAFWVSCSSSTNYYELSAIDDLCFLLAYSDHHHLYSMTALTRQELIEYEYERIEYDDTALLPFSISIEDINSSSTF